MKPQKNDLYSILGVSKDADKNVIKKAYRKKAKDTHPDMPRGSSKKFALVKKAHDILMDDDRRKKYDATGDESEAQPDNAFSAVVGIIANALGCVLADLANKGQSPLETDLVYETRQKIRNSICEFQKQCRIQNGMLDFERKIFGRFKKKKKSEETNVFDSIISSRISGLEQSISMHDKNIKDCEEAIRMIDNIIYEHDELPYKSPGDLMMDRIGAISFFSYP